MLYPVVHYHTALRQHRSYGLSNRYIGNGANWVCPICRVSETYVCVGLIKAKQITSTGLLWFSNSKVVSFNSICVHLRANCTYRRLHRFGQMWRYDARWMPFKTPVCLLILCFLSRFCIAHCFFVIFLYFLIFQCFRTCICINEQSWLLKCSIFMATLSAASPLSDRACLSLSVTEIF